MNRFIIYRKQLTDVIIPEKALSGIKISSASLGRLRVETRVRFISIALKFLDKSGRSNARSVL